MKLNTKIKQQYRAKAHKLKPVVMIAGKGLTETVNQEINRALFDHELIKIRISVADREERRQLFADICKNHRAAPIQLIGMIATLYRKSDKVKE